MTQTRNFHLWYEHTMDVFDHDPCGQRFNIQFAHIHMWKYRQPMAWDLPPLDHFIAYVQRLAKQGLPVIFDIEHFEWRTPAEFARSVKIIKAMVAIFRLYAPKLRLGMYDVGPHRQFLLWRSDRATWFERQKPLAELADLFDFLCPVLYRFYADSPKERDDWNAWTMDMLIGARDLAGRKEVVAFQMLQYHGNAKRPASERMPIESWRDHLAIVRAYGADGLILWANRPKYQADDPYIVALRDYIDPMPPVTNPLPKP